MNPLRCFLLASTLFISSFLCAQKPVITVEQSILQRAALSPKKLAQLQWITGTNDFSWVDTLNKEPQLFRSTIKGSVIPVLKLTSLSNAMLAAGKDSLKKWPSLKWKSEGVIEFTVGNGNYEYDLAGKKLQVKDSLFLPSEAEASEKGPSNKVAYVIDNNIYVADAGKSRQITKDGSFELVYGKSVHREEFGINKGLFWSEDGNKLAFYRMDQSMVTDYPIIDFSPRPAKEKLIKYPFAGAASHHVTLGVYDLNSGKTVYMETGLPAEQYLTNIAWKPDGKSVYIAVLNRDQNHMKLNEYDAASGKLIRTLFEERDEKYVEPLDPVMFIPGKSNMFLWLSRRDGYNHIYLYDTNGKLQRQLTKGNWEVISLTGFDERGDNIYFQCTVNGPLNRDYCAVNLTGKMTRITQAAGMHNLLKHPSGNYFLDTWSDPSTPGITVVRDRSGKNIHEVYRAPDPLSAFSTAEIRLIPQMSKSGDTLWSRMVLPLNFDSTKKYPVILYTYGGPHAQLVNNGWLTGADLWYQALAAKGFIVFTLDNHGTPFRGKKFEQAIFRQVGEIEMEDQLTGIDYLKKQRYVDTTRIGVDGWSYGGFMTVSLMTRHPGVFKVAVAGGPVIDWSSYEVMYTERYMDTPQTNKEGYEKSDLLNYVSQLKGKMMLIHGTSDDVVVWQHSLMYLKKAVSSGVQVDYMVYPGHLHNVTGKDRAHLMRKITDYFEQNL